LPVKYDPQTTCPKIEKFLKDVLRSEEDIKFMLQLIGYCLLNDCRYQVSIMLYGNSGANGKGTLLDLITAFLGADNCSHRSLQSIDTNRANSYRIGNNIENKIGLQISYATPATSVTVKGKLQ